MYLIIFLIVDHAEAIAYSERRRNIGPAVYNRSRLRNRRNHRRRVQIAQSEGLAVSPGSNDETRENNLGKLRYFQLSFITF